MGNTGPFVLKFAERSMNYSQDHSDFTSNMSLNGQCGDDPTHATLYISMLFSTTSFLMVRVIDKNKFFNSCRSNIQ